jgi:hypothetical protein
MPSGLSLTPPEEAKTILEGDESFLKLILI